MKLFFKISTNIYYRFKANEKNIVLDLESVSAPAV
tara:strand:+ start:745 stop:849 length:105 start_codon:yes stop_codon:yes gene_type:complete